MKNFKIVILVLVFATTLFTICCSKETDDNINDNQEEVKKQKIMKSACESTYTILENGWRYLSSTRNVEYDQNGNKILFESVSYNEDGSFNYQSCSRYEYAYDEKNNMIKQTFLTFTEYGAYNYLLSSLYEYIYDNNNLTQVTRTYYNEDGSVKNQNEYKYLYDNKQRLIKEIYMDGAGINKVSSEHEYEYDQNDNLDKKITITYAYDGSVYKKTIIYYEYDSFNNLIKETQTVHINNNSPYISSIIEFKYLNNLNIYIKETNYNSEGEVLKYRINENFYNGNNDLLNRKVLSYKYDGEIIENYEYSYKYEGESLTEELLIKFNNGQDYIESKKTYEFDQQGNECKSCLYKYDGNNGLQLRNKIEQKYNLNNLRVEFTNVVYDIEGNINTTDKYCFKYDDDQLKSSDMKRYDTKNNLIMEEYIDYKYYE